VGDALFFSQVVVSGLTLGSIYALTALGYATIFRATSVVNFAQGEFMMAGAIAALVLYKGFHAGFVASFAVAVAASCVLGLAVERVAYRPLLKAPLFTVILSTVAVGQIMRSGVRTFYGHELSLFPAVFSTEPFSWHGLRLTPMNLGVIGVVLAVLAGIVLFFRWTRTGWAMRATAQNQVAAALVGVSVPRMFSLAWGLSAGLGAAAGILLAPLIVITPDMGAIGIKGFIAAILGGFNSLPGAVLGGFCLGVVENLAGVYVSSGFKDVITFAVLLVVLSVRPAGFLGRPETVRA
jgi:branched-chain amino acid transport system permease protein